MEKQQKTLHVYYKGCEQRIKVYDGTKEEKIIKMIKRVFTITASDEQIFFQDENGDIIILPEAFPQDLSFFVYIRPQYPEIAKHIENKSTIGQKKTLVINSKEEGDIHTPNNTKDNISNFQINTKKAEIEHQNVVDNDIDYLNGNASIEPIIKKAEIEHQNVVDNDIDYLNGNAYIEPIIKKENESFNTPKEKSKIVQYNYNQNFNNNIIPPNNIKVTRSQITAIIRNINDPIKQEELLQMFTGTPIQNRKLFIKKILSICSIIGDIKKHIEILESILKIKINEKVHNVKTKVQSPVNNTNNFQPLPKNQTRNCK